MSHSCSKWAGERNQPELDCCHPANSWQISGSSLAPSCPSSALHSNISYTAEAFWAAQLLFHPWVWWGYKSSSTLQPFLQGLRFSHLRTLQGFHHHSSLLTCCVEVKVGRFIGNVPCCLQSWSFCCHFACISLGFVNIHFKWALWDVLPSKQDWNLGTDRISLDPFSRGRAQLTTIKPSARSNTSIPNTKTLSLRGEGPSIPQPSSDPC